MHPVYLKRADGSRERVSEHSTHGDAVACAKRLNAAAARALDAPGYDEFDTFLTVFTVSPMYADRRPYSVGPIAKAPSPSAFAGQS